LTSTRRYTGSGVLHSPNINVIVRYAILARRAGDIVEVSGHIFDVPPEIWKSLLDNQTGIKLCLAEGQDVLVEFFGGDVLTNKARIRVNEPGNMI
jgi:hypothetical protein